MARPYPKKGMPEKKKPAPLKRTPLQRKVYKIKKVSAKQAVHIEISKKYYAKKIADNILQNRGKCLCENCDDEIRNPTGRNVSHVIGSGGNKALYHEEENSFVLCDRCEDQWTDNNGGEKTEMRIFPKSEEIRIRLTFKYYNDGKRPN